MGDKRSLYFPFYLDLLGHLKFKRFCRALGCDKPNALWNLVSLWSWAMRYFADGEIIGAEEEDIAEECSWEGDSHVFVMALVDSGFLDEIDGGYRLHNWEKYGGKVIQKRENDKERMRRNYEEKAKSSEILREESPNNSRIIRENSGSIPVRVDKIRAEEIRVEEIEIRVKETLKADSGEPEKASALPLDSDPAILEFPTNKKNQTFSLKASKLKQYEETYPGIDVMAEFKKARQWLVDNPSRRKSNVPAFLTKWLNNDRGSKAIRGYPNGGHHYRGTEQSINSPEHKQRLIDMNVLG